MACLHGRRHAWSSLEGVADLAHLLRAMQDVDVPTLVEHAATLRARRAVFMGLLLAREIAGVETPGLEAMLDERTLHLAGPLAERWFQETGAVRVAGRVLVSPSQADWDWLRLPGPPQLLQPLVRPVGLSIRHLAGATAAWRRRPRQVDR